MDWKAAAVGLTVLTVGGGWVMSVELHKYQCNVRANMLMRQVTELQEGQKSVSELASQMARIEIEFAQHRRTLNWIGDAIDAMGEHKPIPKRPLLP